MVSVDTDGDCRLLAPVFTRHGINCLWPFEVQAGCDIEVYRTQYPELTIWGGLDKRALAAGKAEIDAQVQLAARMADRGRYVPMWDHLIPPDVSWANWCYACAQLKKVCYGQSLG
jgi:hypothetical protein